MAKISGLDKKTVKHGDFALNEGYYKSCHNISLYGV